MMMMMMMRMMMRQERLLLLKIVEALLANLAFGSIDEHTLGVLGVPRRAMATNVIAGAMQHVNHAAECPPRRRASSSTRAAVATKERAGARRGAATASGAHGVLALRLTNSTLAREVDRDDAEELRSQVIDRAGSAAIDTVDPLTRVAGDEPGTRLAAELLSRVDDSVLAAANKAGAVLEKGLPSLQGAATKAQSMDLSPGSLVVFAPRPALFGLPSPVPLFLGLASDQFQVPLQAAAGVSGAVSIPPVWQVRVLAARTVGHVKSKLVRARHAAPVGAAGPRGLQQRAPALPEDVPRRVAQPQVPVASPRPGGCERPAREHKVGEAPVVTEEPYAQPQRLRLAVVHGHGGPAP